MILELKNFSMKDMREATYILGIKSYKDISKRLLGLSQSMYIDKMLKWFSVKESKREYFTYFAYDTSSRICALKHKLRDMMEIIPYTMTMDIRSIICVMICIRPDISYVLSIMSIYQFNPSKSH